MHAEALSEDAKEDRPIEAGGAGAEDEKFDLVGDDGQYIIRNNRLTIDDPSRQALGMEEIELLKKSINTGSGKDIIAKIMESHSALSEKTAFSLAKYTLRKSKKYLKRFTLVPLDVNTLSDWLLHEKDAARTMELRHEHLGLAASWSNVHVGSGDLTTIPLPGAALSTAHDAVKDIAVGGGRWLVVDETSGLLVAALAERMGILHHEPESSDDEADHDDAYDENEDEKIKNGTVDLDDARPNGTTNNGNHKRKQARPMAYSDSMSATSNTLTLIHAATQPNLSLLNYFDFDPHVPSAHVLHAHLKTLSWLQLLHPDATPSYTSEPPALSEEQLKAMKPSKRGNYYRKRRRWQKVVRVVDETRAGGFDGLVVAGVMQAESILRHLVPLVRGGGQVVVYSPAVEPVAQLCDAYSSARKTAYINSLGDGVPAHDMDLDPRLLLAPTLQTARAREWQVLPGRTHPVMTGRGGSEGYIFTATRVLPAEGRVAARGVYTKKRKTEAGPG